MARSRAACATLAVALLGSAGWGWWSGGRVAARFDATVVHVADGDTIVVDVAGRTEKVRILGADTPEVADPRKPVQCYGPEASAYTKTRLAPGTRVSLETDTEVRDKYGRLLAYVYVGGVRYDDELLRLGLARLLIIPPNGVHARAMLQAELDARAAGRGLWSACGGS
ncbi:MAG: nuclease (SNase domain protein) [Actinomycetia bacterium]|nr:nuclease (SNase domain protein) [Actinomycetes bacterium]